MIDWKTIETEYVTTDISHRQLAEKHGIGRSRLSQYASKEKWKEKRDKHRANIVSKTVNAIASQQAHRAVRLLTVADKLLTKVEQRIEEGGERLMDTSTMLDISRILKNIKDAQMIKSDADMREQEARTDKLRAETQQRNHEDDDDETGVILMPAVLEVKDDG